MSETQARMDGPFGARDLVSFASELLVRSGMPQDRAQVVAEILVEGDLLGHTTHGVQLLSPYLKSIEAGTMALQGEPEVVADNGAALTWNGNFLPGPWLTVRALETAFDRCREQSHPVVTVVITHSHHIACLAAYLKRATDRGLCLLLASSDPSVQTVAPFGGIKPLYTPNPVAAGIPTEGEPILIDISTSCTANGLVMRMDKEGKRLPGPWLQDSRGNATDEPSALFTDPPGTVLPLGGRDLGYKGFALGLIVEALTSALGGFGRSREPESWGASVFLQVIDPEAFGGRALFERETSWLAKASKSSPVKPGNPPVRVPGERALRLRAEQMQKGVLLYPTILPGLEKWSEKLGVALPEPLA